MKKKIIAVASAFCLSVASLGMVDLRVSAQENEKGQEDFSYLLTGDVIIGQMQPETKEYIYRVVHLLSRMLVRVKLLQVELLVLR